MKKNVFASLGLSLLITATVIMPATYAAEKKSSTEKIEVTPMADNVSDQELAAIYVLSEICPSLIGKDLKFNTAYENLAQAFLANEKDAVKMLNKRAKAKDFQVALTEARNDANAASEDDNRQICDDVRNYYSK
ncbi:MAG: hypothetical protein KA331_01865 [Acinetobacter sp.]|nr:hypothetical protein [Acinetobacter sp.]